MKKRLRRQLPSDVRTQRWTICQATGVRIRPLRPGRLFMVDPLEPSLIWVRFEGMDMPYKLIKAQDLEDLL